MDWARDQLGNLIQAAQRGLFSYWLRCPTCGEPVRRRAGLERRPHFAHYSYSAKPECEYYHPSSGSAVHGSPQARDEEQATSSSSSLQGGLFLERRASSYSMYLKLPRLAAEAGDIGELKIWAGLGERTYTASQLQRAKLVPAIVQLPLVKVSASGALAHAAEAIRMHVSMFRSAGNYFRVSEAGGRLLAPLEPLEWGERYRLLTQEALGSAPVDFGIEVESNEGRRGWIFYELRLPTLAQAGDDSTREAIGRYLGRTINAPRARVYFVDPPAHHVEPDGTHIFPETTERIVLRRPGGSRVTIVIGAQSVNSARVRDLGDEWCEVTGFSTDEFIVLLDEREELLGRFEKCDLFRPEGVRVVVGEQVWEIFQPELRDAVQHRSHKVVRIECPTMLVTEQLALEKNAWTQDGKVFTLLEPQSEPIADAGNFGALAWLETTAPAFESRKATPQVLATRVWIEGLVARLDGPDALLRLRINWNGATSEDALGVRVSELVWLQPHLHFVRSG